MNLKQLKKDLKSSCKCKSRTKAEFSEDRNDWIQICRACGKVHKSKKVPKVLYKPSLKEAEKAFGKGSGITTELKRLGQ